MTRLRGGSLFAAAAFLAACGGGLQSFDGVYPARSRGAQDATALAMPHFAQRPVHPDRSGSSMSPDAKNDKALLYIGDDSTNDVYVYDYKSGKPAGTLTGFDGPYGECVDADGDIYVANFDAGDAIDFAHGGIKVLNTYNSGGTPIDCSVDSKRDVAVTSFDPGEVTVFTGGDPSEGTTYSGGLCGYLLSMAYDDKGNLVGLGEGSNGGRIACALLAGSKTMTVLTTKGFPSDFGGGTIWDGKYFAIPDQLASYQGGIIKATLKGKTLLFRSQTLLSDNCYKDYVDVVSPFIVGKTNTLFYGKQGNALVGLNLWCPDGGKSEVDYWHYPAGGLPYMNLSGASSEPYGVAVSIGK